MPVLVHVSLKLLAVHMYGTEAWSAHRYIDLIDMLVNLPMNSSVPTNEAHPDPQSLFTSIYVVCIAMVLQCLHLTIRALHLSLWSILHWQLRTVAIQRSVSRWNGDNDASPIDYEPWAHGNWLSSHHLTTYPSYRCCRKPTYLYILYLVVNPWRCLSTKDK